MNDDLIGKDYGPRKREGLLTWAVHENGLVLAFVMHDAQDDEPRTYGYVKWDGCVNWSTTDTCMEHFCGAEGLKEWLALFLQATRIAQRELGGRIDSDCFDWGDLWNTN